MRKEFTVKLKYAVVIEKAPNNYAAYVPDLPGYVSTAKTRGGMVEMVREGIAVYVEYALECGEQIPEPRSSLADAMRCYLAALDESDDAFYAERGITLEDWDEEEISFVMVEAEVNLTPAALADAPELAGAAARV